ncbi:hypothetical protein [Bernardetia sp.]|uniref:LpxL/LpxP family acyltransferase n=1 Tax=Bernardetia sp. TaxID=1937974 RepID=UPI0025BACFD6|nr:hypothetical protein [Bernardetia sp.]
MSEVAKKIEQLKQSFSFNNKEEENEFFRKNSYLFATTSASLFRLMPQIPYTEHKSIFQKLLHNLQLLDIEEQNPTFFAPHFEVVDEDNILEQTRNGKPFLFCCFHLGAYSLLPTLFTYNDLEFGFLLNETLHQRKANIFSEAHKNLCIQIGKQEKTSVTSKMHLINVEEKKGIWQAIKMLKEGKSLIVYPDGNISSNNSNKQSKNLANIQFLSEDLMVRQGVAFLSYLCDVPIVPVISSRIYAKGIKTIKRKFEFLPSIYTQKNNVSKEEYSAQTMQKLYAILESEVIKNSKNTSLMGEWEGWIFVNKFFKQIQKDISKTNRKMSLSNKENVSYVFNEERFALIENLKDKSKNILFDKFTHRFFPASELLCEIITYFFEPKKLYLFDKTNNNNNLVVGKYSPISTETDAVFCSPNSKLEIAGTLISMGMLDKLIEKGILI